MTKTDKALSYFKNNYNCSQSVFVAFSDDFNIPESQCLKIACAFGAGMGRQQHTCGAITGALMALGMKFGKDIEDDDSQKIKTYKKTITLFEEFKKIHGSTNCKELLNNLDFKNDADYQKMIEMKIFDNKCNKYVEDAVKLTDKLINSDI